MVPNDRQQALSAQHTTRLRQLSVFPGKAQKVHIILVPGLGTLRCDLWGILTPPWTHLLNGLDPEIAIHAFDPGVALDDHFAWQLLLDAGLDLLSSLDKFQPSNISSGQPLIFICHGLGGSIVKQALCIADIHYDRYSSLLNSIAGTVFLGTPHDLEGVSTQQFGERLTAILKIDTGLTTLGRQSLSRLRDSASLMSDLADRFQSRILGINILSIIEKCVVRTKDSGRLTQRKKRMIVVDEYLCATNMRREQKLGVNLDHMQLPTMCEADGQVISGLWVWLESIIKDSPVEVQSRLDHESEVRSERSPSVNSLASVLSYSEARLALGNQVQGETMTRTSSCVNASSIPDLETLLDSFSIRQADPRIPCLMMDTFVRNKEFFGRKTILSKLDECLLPSQTLLVSSQPDRTRVALLCGMGGLGKTETAIEYAYSRENLYDVILWVRAEDSSKLEGDIAQIAVRLGIQDPNEPNDKAINRGLAIEWLCNPFKIRRSGGKPRRDTATWLLIFDNADDPDILSPYRDVAMSGAVLITSRSPLARTSFSQSTTNIDLEPFDTKESARFVQKLSGIEGHLDEAGQVGGRLGGLPLALAQMAGLIRIHYMTYDQFLELYNDVEEERDVHETVLQPLRTTARGNISTVWALERLSKEARVLLEISAFLDPDCIQESVLMSHAGSINIPFYPKKKFALFEARRQLIGSSLFRYNQDKGEFWMHRVTRDVVRAKMTGDHRRTVFNNVLNVLSAAWPAPAVGGHDVTLWEISEALYPHICNLKDAYLKYFAQEDANGNFELARLLTRAAWYQHERGESHDILPVLELALDLCQRYSCSRDSMEDQGILDLESDILYTLGAVANETNDPDACIAHTKRFLDIRLKIAEQTCQVDERLARAHNQMGIAWILAQEYDKAEEVLKASSEKYEVLPNYTKDMKSLPLVNLGLAYWLQGKLEEASDVLELGLSDREELYGVMDNHSFRTGRFLYALGNVRFSQGRVEESEDFHRRALKQFQSTLRSRHHRTADVCHKVAQHCLRNGHYDQGIAFIDQALKVWSVDPQKYAPEIARTTYLKAKILFSTGQEDEATRIFQNAIALRKRIAGMSKVHDMDLTEDDFDKLVTFWSR